MVQRDVVELDAPPRKTRVRQDPIDKYEMRRIELAEAGLKTLAKLGYAKTSMREIAENSDFTHAVLHYYFADKSDLICYSIKHFKAKCVTRYDVVLAESATSDELLQGFIEKLKETIVNETQLHCLWYDLRSQALFEPTLRDVVTEIDESLEKMIWRIVLRYAELKGGVPSISSSCAYATLDGLFQMYLLRIVSGDAESVEHFLDEIRNIVPLLVK
ncbi:TetR/AcrR family transcriptional regulator [Acinetobacter gerneri]|jgi:AcrR family transcriptional regulator|uniref:TetR/AcrR family transcriptional regulator n=1 Tax=Acinetobacter gerneri TaxID=202952 RepID=UPI0023F33B29|nr:TetR/AcrR family transcriptional regulator [Acinetobacter gerneri]MCH4243377.1 TetR/AcrR family transcriptional regulator [Acinetobacter gerneri]